MLQLKVFKAASGSWLPAATLLPSLAISTLCIGIIRTLPVLFKSSKVLTALTRTLDLFLYHFSLILTSRSVYHFCLSIPSAQVPASLVAIVGSTLAAIGLRLPIKSLADTVGRAIFVGGLASLPPFLGLPKVPLNMHTLRIISTTAIGTTIIGG